MVSSWLQHNISLVVSTLMGFVGACFGSFAAVIIYRLPMGQSIVTPRSYCVGCKKQLSFWQNVPIFSWLFLRGKCFYCRTPIGLRAIVIELIMALSILAIYSKFGLTFAFFERSCLVFLLVCISYVDIDTYSIPFSLLGALLLAVTFSSIYYYIFPTTFVAPHGTFSLFELMILFSPSAFSLSDRLWGALAGLLFLSSVNLIATFLLRRSGRLLSNQWAMGWGDPLLLMCLGLFVGLSHVVLVVFLASLTGAVVSLLLQLQKKPDEIRDSDIAHGAVPFGPFLALASLYVYLF